MPQLIHIAGVGVGVVLLIAGFILLREGRTLADERSSGKGEPSRVPGVSGLPPAARTMIALCLLVTAYHVVAYSLPDSIQLLRVPVEHLWMLVLAMVVSVAVIGWADRADEPSGSGPPLPPEPDEPDQESSDD